MNNKGFAITTILYGVLILFCLLLLSMLGILATYRNNLAKLVDENNGARAIAQNNSINAATFKSGDSSLTYQGNGVYHFSKKGQWSSGCLQPALFVEGQRYRLSYSIQKTDGTLKSIGGHSTAASELVFYLDDQLQELDPTSTKKINPYHDVGPVASGYAPEENLADDTDVHNIVIEFNYVPAEGTNGKVICIQPNRGLTTSVDVNIFDIKLKSLSK